MNNFVTIKLPCCTLCVGFTTGISCRVNFTCGCHQILPQPTESVEKCRWKCDCHDDNCPNNKPKHTHDKFGGMIDCKGCHPEEPKPQDTQEKLCLGCHTLGEDNPFHDCKPKTQEKPCHCGDGCPTEDVCCGKKLTEEEMNEAMEEAVCIDTQNHLKKCIKCSPLPPEPTGEDEDC